MTKTKEEDDVGGALPGEQILRESQLKAAEAKKKKKSDTKIIHPSEALLLPLASLNMGDMGTAMRRGCFFFYFYFFCTVSAG